MAGNGISPTGQSHFTSILALREQLDWDSYVKNEYVEEGVLSPLEPNGVDKITVGQWKTAIDYYFSQLTPKDKEAFIALFQIKDSTGKLIPVADLDHDIISDKILTNKALSTDYTVAANKIKQSKGITADKKAIWLSLLLLRERLDSDSFVKNEYTDEGVKSILSRLGVEKITIGQWKKAIDYYFGQLTPKDKEAFIALFQIKDSTGKLIPVADLDHDIISDKILTKKDSSLDYMAAVCQVNDGKKFKGYCPANPAMSVASTSKGAKPAAEPKPEITDPSQIKGAKDLAEYFDAYARLRLSVLSPSWYGDQATHQLGETPELRINLDPGFGLDDPTPEFLAPNLALEVGGAFPLVGKKGFFAKSSFNLSLISAFKMASFETSDSGLITPRLGLLAHFNPTKYLQPWVAFIYGYRFERYQNPTVFCPNTNDSSLLLKGGILSAFHKYAAVNIFFAHRYKWLNQAFPNPINPDEQASLTGNERLTTLGLELLLKVYSVRLKAAIETNFNGSEGTLGETIRPEFNMSSSDTTVVQAVGYLRGLLEASYGDTFASLGIISRSYKKSPGWTEEFNLQAILGHKDLTINGTRLGSYSLTYNFTQQDPIDKLTTQSLFFNVTEPWLDAITMRVGGFLDHPSFGLSFDFDLLALIDLFR